MKIYVASSWKNLRQPYVVADLRAAGHEVYDFKNPAPGNHGFAWKSVSDTAPPWSAVETRQILDHPIAKQGFKYDFDAMHWADAVVMVQPCGISAGLELAWAVGAGKLAIALLSDGHEPELMLKMADHLCVSMEEVLEALKRGKKTSNAEIAKILGDVFDGALTKVAEQGYDRGYHNGLSDGLQSAGSRFDELSKELAEEQAAGVEASALWCVQVIALHRQLERIKAIVTKAHRTHDDSAFYEIDAVLSEDPHEVQDSGKNG